MADPILVIHIEEIFGTALLMDWLHGERRLVIGGGERVSEPAIVLRGPAPSPKGREWSPDLSLARQRACPQTADAEPGRKRICD